MAVQQRQQQQSEGGGAEQAADDDDGQRALRLGADADATTRRALRSGQVWRRQVDDDSELGPLARQNDLAAQHANATLAWPAVDRRCARFSLGARERERAKRRKHTHHTTRAEFMGVHLWAARVRERNARITNVERKNGCIINNG